MTSQIRARKTTFIDVFRSGSRIVNNFLMFIYCLFMGVSDTQIRKKRLVA